MEACIPQRRRRPMMEVVVAKDSFIGLIHPVIRFAVAKVEVPTFHEVYPHIAICMRGNNIMTTTST